MDSLKIAELKRAHQEFFKTNKNQRFRFSAAQGALVGSQPFFLKRWSAPAQETHFRKSSKGQLM